MTPPPSSEHSAGHDAIVPASADPGPGRLMKQLGSAADRDQLDRMLLALAVHAEGAGFERAEWLAWDDFEARFSARRRARAAESLPWAEALDRARFGDARGVEIAEGRPLKDGFPPEPLRGPAQAVWTAADGVQLVVEPDAAHKTGAVALWRGGERYALLAGEWPKDQDGDRMRTALERYVATAEWAIASFDRAEEREQRTRRLAGITELVRATVSPGNIAEVFHLALRVAVEGSGAKGGALWIVPPGGDTRLEVTHGPASQRERLGRALQPIADQVIQSGRRRVIERGVDEMLLPPETGTAVASGVVVPITAYGRALGALAVYDRSRRHPGDPWRFDAHEQEFLGLAADQAALAIEHAGRLHDLRQAEQRQQELQGRVRRAERLATLGEVAARMVHEARNPVASIRTFARRVRGSLAETDPNLECLEIVLREVDRLERLMGEQLEYSETEPPTLRVESINDIVQSTLQRVGEVLVRRRIRLVKKLSPDVPALLLDADRISQVTSRLLESALEAVSIGGRIRVESRRAGGYAVVEVAHDGLLSSGSALDQLFMPFATSRSGGPGVGLGVAQRIVREHGGEIRVRTEGEWSSVVVFTIPIPENQDRRRTHQDRRRAPGDRRHRLPQT